MTYVTQADQVYCVVEDGGPGLPTDIKDDIFNFLRTSKSQGMVLGLWLSKYIVQSNRGYITYG